MTFDAVLQQYGAAMFAAQQLEAFFVEANAFFAKNARHSVPDNTPKRTQVRSTKRTLGQLTKTWKRHWCDKERLHSDVLEYFDDITAIRNSLAHSFFRLHRFEQFDSDSLEKQVQELTAIREDLQTGLIVLAALDHKRRDKTDWTRFRQGM